MIDPLHEVESMCIDLQMDDTEVCDTVTDAWLFEWAEDNNRTARLVTAKAVKDMMK